MRKFIIQDEMYHNDFTLYVNCSGQELADYIKEKYKVLDFKVPPADGQYCNIEERDKEKGSHRFIRLVWIKTFNWTVVEQGLLVHELLHYVFDNLDLIGMKPTDSSEEAYTYYLQHIIQQCYQELKKLHPKYKKKYELSRRSKTRKNKRS